MLESNQLEHKSITRKQRKQQSQKSWLHRQNTAIISSVLRLSPSRWQTSRECIVLYGVYILNCSSSLSQEISQIPYEQNKF
ncbi:LOW QUALITY PROTEIN: hypothetical protein PanWU01x14_360650 [Parasponia andersonii]|uniref:Uncharacterized protein n=1 Tax=Parasponia andersonii TaxID=3476 RepID=A0A2P5A7K1_PARAD|nr:LOW QUALITY PROTEIN: hypothetical protein PanWU01x14_360650 [Parasponia andersonii]